MAGSCPGGRSNPRWSSTSWCATSTSPPARPCRDRKSTRLNSSHGYISYAVFCLKKKTLTNRIGPVTILIIIFTISFYFLGVPLTGSVHVSSPFLYRNNPVGTNPYVTTFPISKNSSDFTPFVLYPASSETVWVVTIKPPQAQILNFTLGASGKPIVTAVITLRNAIPSDIVYDRLLTRVWFLENNSLAYYNSTTRGNLTVERTFPGGSPQSM